MHTVSWLILVLLLVGAIRRFNEI
ncbi:GlyGly-CTERM sorting domain-containing protein [Escherichia coli]|nr:GlyGly-CTERM sorting domain-containing protein [Escherichia coli]EFA4632970.1 GlyGly-CTERM sorting domain-containing protein [Escherichia coli]